MIDYASIAPMMSLSTFMAGFIIVLLSGRAIVELIELIEKRKARGIGSSNPAGQRRHLSPSQKCIENYYNTYRKGA